MTPRTELDTPSWWASLTHGGMLIAPARLAEYLPADCPPLPRYLVDRLRRDLLRFRDGDAGDLATLLDTVLEDVLGLSRTGWTKGASVDPRWSCRAVTGEVVKPRRVWQTTDGLGNVRFVLPVFVTDRTTADRYGDDGRLGVGRGRRSVSRTIEWLRRSGEKIALLTNGRQWRLLHAGADYDAWCEWDTDLWFEEGEPSPQVTALRILLSATALTAAKPEEQPPLTAAILASRRGQAELSSALGERVRLAVEVLIRESSDALTAIDGNDSQHVSRRDIYIAATRLVMRCVVILFAEARDLLPRDNAIYHGCYGIQGLREQLARLSGGRAERLRHAHGAWPRLLGLFRLIYDGSAHEALPIPRYGGGLFAPGDRSSADAVRRALAAFEDSINHPSDAAIHEILELLTVSKVKVRQGRSSTWVPAPVDFSDLSSEYIGILYEGLLDFELHRAPQYDAVVFLRLGDEPALPLSRLEEEMAPRRLAELIGKFNKSTKKLADAEAEGEEESSSIAGEEEAAPPEDEPTVETADDDTSEEAVAADEDVAAENGDFDISRELRERAEIWAEKAVKEAKLVPYPRSDADPAVRERWNRAVKQKARSLYRLVLPSQWYLVRWGGTRKGAGTFYTRPQLAVPTVHRVLRPLCYEPGADEKATAASWTPRRPEDILALKVCDPAMGSASLLVAALRYLTDALVESLHFHKRLQTRADGTVCKLADGLPLDHPSQETIPVPADHPEFDDRLRARLKRHVVERCIYGVDVDPLAVELARMAVWIETMDRRLPFGFLDHKLRCGNALVGCWFDRFQDYPVMAFERDNAGDKNHDRFVHHFREFTAERGKKKGEVQRAGDVWTERWKNVKEDVIKPEMRDWIGARGPQGRLAFLKDRETPASIHDEAIAVFRALHEIPVHEVGERERLYSERIDGNPALARLREAFDTWCAIWFWPGDDLDTVPTPKTFLDPPAATRKIVARLRDEHHFFHWEIEFPDVFTGPNSGFSAMVGNPPWEIQKPNSKEFFSNVDPLFRTYGKQEALRCQTQFFERNAATEHGWLAYVARFKSLSIWNKHAAFPSGDTAAGENRFGFGNSARDNAALHDLWRGQRAGRTGYADPEHPFRHQGSADINTYKMFIEAARAALREDGFLGFITPAGIYTDKGATDLRKLLLDRSRWEWLFGFINRNKIFAAVYYRFKFCVLIVRKGGQTSSMSCAFVRSNVDDWLEAERHALAYPRERVAQFSPRFGTILEIRSERDLALLETIYRNAVLLGDDGPDGWGIQYAREFDMTGDSKLFPTRPQWEERGYRPNDYGMWIGPNGDVALPLYEGRMIGQFDFSEKGWVSGKGRTAIWREIPWASKTIEPQYLMSRDGLLESPKAYWGPKISYMRITSTMNSHTSICTFLNALPAGDSVFFFRSNTMSLIDSLAVVGFLGTFAFDYQVRSRLGGLNLSEFVMIETSLPARSTVGKSVESFVRFVACLALPNNLFASEWLSIVPLNSRTVRWRQLWAVTENERLRMRCTIDAVTAQLYGLAFDDLVWILRDCDHSAVALRTEDFTHTLDPKGFWRIAKDRDPELRHTVLTLVAFHELKRIGLDAFLALNDGEGWMLPDTLRLADYGLGHDDHAKEPQPVASRLGPRFLPWQLTQGIEDSWEECARHAERIDVLLGRTSSDGTSNAVTPAADKPKDLFGNPLATDLFGAPTEPDAKRRR